MKKFRISVEVIEYDDIEVEAESEEDAYEQAHKIMDQAHYGGYELHDCEEVTNG